VAAIIVVVIFVVMMVFSGLLVELANVFKFLRWIQWMSAFRYAANVLTINEFRDTRFCLINNNDLCQSGNGILQHESIDFTSNWDMWKYFAYLTVMAVVFFTMAYVRLLLIKKIK
jgi:ATP-binding cassette subfamily G (WHITE) protein 2